MRQHDAALMIAGELRDAGFRGVRTIRPLEGIDRSTRVLFTSDSGAALSVTVEILAAP